MGIWNRNKWMHLACGVSFLLTVSLTFIPGIKEIFKLDNPAWFYYFISFIFAFACAANDEFWKLIYRRVLINRLKSHKGPVELVNIREHVEMAVEMLHEVEKKVDKCQGSLTENRHTIGRVKVEVDSLTHNNPLKRFVTLLSVVAQQRFESCVPREWILQYSCGWCTIGQSDSCAAGVDLAVFMRLVHERLESCVPWE